MKFEPSGRKGTVPGTSGAVLLRVPPAALESLNTELRRNFANEFVGVRSYRRTEDQMGEDLLRAENYLSLVGLVVLVLGGIGVSSVTRVFVQQNLNSMAMKLGEMQAQLTRLDALGERLSALAGIRPQEFRFAETPGRCCRRRTCRWVSSARSCSPCRARWKAATTCSACWKRSFSSRR